MRYSVFLVLLVGPWMRTVFAQNDAFFVNGTATQLNDRCFRLTQNIGTFEVGSIWYPEKVDLRNDFDLVMDMFFGCSDSPGADGIVFGLQPISASVGEAGEGLGLGGVRPSLGVEFDTYYNDNRQDPTYDHVAIMANGQVTHSGPNNLAGPVQARANSRNIETCTFLPLRVTWDARRTILRVYFDCELRLEYTGDIVRDIFGGDPFVYYGFAGATGGETNVQEVCFRFNSFQRQLEDVTVCPGGKALLDLTGATRYEWSPAAGLNSSTAASVEASPDTTTTYTVKLFDDCGIPVQDRVTVTVAGDSAFVNLGPDTTICPNDPLLLDVSVPTAVYRWSDSTLSGPSVSITTAGTYTVTATRTDIICTASDRIEVGTYTIPDFAVGPPDTTLCVGEGYKVYGQYPEGQTFLSDGTRFDSITLFEPGRYGFYLEHPCVLLEDEIVVDRVSCREFYLPNAFSPDGDGVNDFFFPQDSGDLLNVHVLRVYDRWGGLVYESTDLLPNAPELGWDGRVGRGQPAAAGAYVWVMDVTFRNGRREVERGTIQLLR
jgi:gliding motility-associated-like protein